MEELIFFAVLIFFSIVESIARSRKQRKGGGPLPDVPPDWEQEWERQSRAEPAGQSPRPRPRLPQQGRPEVPSYDDDESFDARTSAEEGRSFEVRSSSEAEPSFDEAASSETERKKRAESSESMIPSDIWEEIAGLAREAKVELPLPPPRPKPQPKPRPTGQRRELPPEPRRAQPRPASVKLPPLRTRPTPPSPIAEPALEGTAAHAVHQSHTGYGTDPSERARSAQDGLDPLARLLDADAAAIRQQLRSKGAHALRQAMILYEVVGPPVGSRPGPYSE